MDILLVPLLLLTKSLFSILVFVVLADVVISILLMGNVLNTNNQIVYAIINSIKRVCNIMCDPIRKRFPVLVGTLDFSPVVVILILSFLEHVIVRILMKLG